MKYVLYSTSLCLKILRWPYIYKRYHSIEWLVYSAQEILLQIISIIMFSSYEITLIYDQEAEAKCFAYYYLV